MWEKPRVCWDLTAFGSVKSRFTSTVYCSTLIETKKPAQSKRAMAPGKFSAPAPGSDNTVKQAVKCWKLTKVNIQVESFSFYSIWHTSKSKKKRLRCCHFLKSVGVEHQCRSWSRNRSRGSIKMILWYTTLYSVLYNTFYCYIYCICIRRVV
jgi:hypothetical protein